MSFKAGDRVRLKLKPEIVGRVTEPSYIRDELYVRWDEGIASGWRYPEELDLIPPPEPLVAVMLPLSAARKWAEEYDHGPSHRTVLIHAVRDALEVDR